MPKPSLAIRISCGGRPIKLSVRLDCANAALIRRFLDTLSVDAAQPLNQSRLVNGEERAIHEIPARDSVLSIDGAGQLRALASDWQDQLVAFGRRPETAKAYRAVLEVFIVQAGWTEPADISSGSVERVIAAKRQAKEWMGDTSNRNVSIVRGFVKFLNRKGHSVASSSIDDVPRAKSDGTDGVRAATRQEASRFLAVVCAREMVRNCQPANRTLQHLLMFLAGLRPGEAAKLEWRRHIILDDPIPYIHWSRDISKSNRAADIALHPELVTLLREHRESMAILAKAMPVHFVKAKRGKNKGKSRPRPVDPNVPGSFVFPFVGTCFERDLQRSGIVKADARGRTFAPRSARKFFKSELTMLGIDGKIVDFLMRHRGGVDVRYLDLPKEFQLSEVSKLPGLAPAGAGKFVNLVNSWVERRSKVDYAFSGEDDDQPHLQLQRQHRTEGGPSSQTDRFESAVLPPELSRASGARNAGNPRSIESDELTKAASGLSKNVESEKIADLLESLARLLRGSTNGTESR